eukprot:GHVL01032877.1.p1 GENE.GHVL01032877.1~~GHVL01032877.1.p1  ORF type:complete len:114 (+),score=16.96 GHVL01032877.1:82-423(+)
MKIVLQPRAMLLRQPRAMLIRQPRAMLIRQFSSHGDDGDEIAYKLSLQKSLHVKLDPSGKKLEDTLMGKIRQPPPGGRRIDPSLDWTGYITLGLFGFFLPCIIIPHTGLMDWD